MNEYCFPTLELPAVKLLAIDICLFQGDFGHPFDDSFLSVGGDRTVCTVNRTVSKRI